MTTLRQDIVKRIERLPKPTNVTTALQPLFEAVSNAIHSTQAKYQQNVSTNGRITVTVSTDRKKGDVWATVEDNGEGLNSSNWEAFTTTDTDNKIKIGGKGVGRLLWLDCFKNIAITSTFLEDGVFKRRSFHFVLTKTEQIQNHRIEYAAEATGSSFYVKFTGLRNNGYLDKFPGRDSYIFQHITSHFLPTFIGKRCPRVTVIAGSESQDFPNAINKIVLRRDPEIIVPTEKYEKLHLTLMECDKVASADLKGSHFVHFIAHDRTVHSQCIDSKLGLKQFGHNSDRVFHAILTGNFLDKNVNQERTAFLFESKEIETIINDVCSQQIETFLKEPLANIRGAQRQKIENITATYPSVAFGDTEELQKKVPIGEVSEDAIYSHLARERFRRDKKQADKIRGVLERLKTTAADTNIFASAIADAGKAIEDAEQRSLAEYVVRRKVVIDFMDILLEKIRDDRRDSAYQREDILHSLICPMKVNTINSEGRRIEAATSHDLWIIDERLTFAQYFSSDIDFATLSKEINNQSRPDILIFDHVHGLRQSDASSSILLVELKRPGRTNYRNGENPQYQMQKYIQQLQTGKFSDVKGRPIKLSKDTIFYCFIVADIVGKLDEWTFSWQHTVDGRGRVYRPDSGFKGSIELIGWDTLLQDAKARNKAFFDKAGITGESFFSTRM